jgi:hypothetical protein
MKRITATVATGIIIAAIVGSAAPAHAASGARASTRMAAACASVPKTTTVYDGLPGPIFWKRVQCMASRESARPYTGPIDGVMGPNSWMGAQARLAVGNYYQAELEDYENGATVAAFRRWANAHGYNLEVHGDWDTDAYRAAADCLNKEF